MPFYSFKCNDCSEIFEVTCRIGEMKSQHCSNCNSVNYETHHTDMNIGDPVRLGVRTIDNGFREVLSKINSKNWRSNLGSKLSRS